MIRTDIQIRYTDIDFLGHVNNSVLQVYFDMSKNEYFTNVMQMPVVWEKFGFVVAQLTNSFMSPILITDKITIYTKIEKVGNRSLVFIQEILGNETKELKARSESVLVSFDIETQKSTDFPESLKRLIIEHEGI